MHAFEKIKSLSEHPAVVATSIASGISIGLFFHSIVPYVTPLGEIFVDLLGLCLIPIVFCSIVRGVTTLMKSSQVLKKISVIALVFLLSIILPATVGMVAGLVGSPKHIVSQDSMAQLGKVIKSIEYYPEVPKDAAQHLDTSKKMLTAEAVNLESENMLELFIPKNVLAELASSLSIKIILLAIVIGLAMGAIHSKVSTSFVGHLELIREVFEKLFECILVALPVGLIGMFASALSKMDMQLLRLLAWLVVALYVAGIVLLLIYNFILAFALRKSFWGTLNEFKQIIFMTFVVENALIPLPRVFAIFKREHVDPRIGELLLPLGATLNQHGRIFLFSMITIFIANFYGIHLSLADLGILFFLSIVTGAAASGEFALIAPIYMVICKTLGLPADLGALILISLDPFIMRLTEIITLYGNCSLVALIQRKELVRAKV